MFPLFSTGTFAAQLTSNEKRNSPCNYLCKKQRGVASGKQKVVVRGLRIVEPSVMEWADPRNQETPGSGQCCSAEGDGDLAMGSRPLTSCLLILLYTLRSLGACCLEL